MNKNEKTKKKISKSFFKKTEFIKKYKIKSKPIVKINKLK